MRAFLTWFFSLALFASGCAACSTIVSPKPPTPTIVAKPAESPLPERLQHQTIALVKPAKDDPDVAIPYCSAVWITRTHILTAAHCVEEQVPPDVQKLFPDIKMMMNPVGTDVEYVVFSDMIEGDDVKMVKARPAKVIFVANDIDLALLIAPTAGAHPVVSLKPTHLKVGDPIHIMGHPSMLAWTYMAGYVSQLRYTKPGSEFTHPFHLVQIASPIWAGDSGCGAFDADGNLAGIALFVINRGPFLTFFIDRSEVIGFLDRSGIVY